MEFQGFISKSELANELKISWKNLKKRLRPHMEGLISEGYKTNDKLLTPSVAAFIRDIFKKPKAKKET